MVFIHPHKNIPPVGRALVTWIGIFVFVAVLEELFFRAWVQNLLERRVGRGVAFVFLCFRSFRLVTFQQKEFRVGVFQLALRVAGNDCRDFLWAGMERPASSAGLGDYAYV